MATLTLIGSASALLIPHGKPTQQGNNLNYGLIGHWPLDGNANDTSGYSNNGTINGSVSGAANRNGVADSAMSFNSTSNSTNIMVPNAPVLSPTSITISAWFNVSAWTTPPSGGGDNGIICKDVSGSLANCAYDIHFNSDHTLVFYIDNKSNSAVALNSINPLNLHQWYHVAATFSGTTMNLYINDVLQGTATQTNIGITSGTLNIGIQKVSVPRYFNGAIDDVRLYNRSLSASEIQALYQSSGPSINLDSGQAGLVGWWKLAGNANDSSPYRNGGAWTSVPTYTADRKGTSNNAALFNGSTSTKITKSNINMLTSTSAFTASVWSKGVAASGGDGYATIFRYGTTSADSAGSSGDGYYSTAIFAITVNSSNRYYMFFPANSDSYVTNIVASPSTWHLLTMTYDGNGTVNYYVDGVIVATKTGASITEPIANDQLNIGGGYYYNGSSTTQRNLNGAVADARIYSRALTATEISTLYQSYNPTLNVDTTTKNINLSSGLVGYWPFNGNANDATPYRDNGIVNSVTLTTDRRGRANSAYSGGNGTAGISAPAHSNLPANNITVSVWIKIDTFTSGQALRIVNNGWASVVGGWLLYTYNDSTNGTKFGINWPASNSQHTATGPPLSIGAWHNVVGTYDGTNIKLYEDGTLVASTSYGGASLYSQSSVISIMSPDASGDIYDLDDVRLYNRALSSQEVQALYNEYN